MKDNKEKTCGRESTKYVELLEEDNKSLKRRCCELQMKVYEQQEKIERLLSLNVDKDEYWKTIRENLKKV